MRGLPKDLLNQRTQRNERKVIMNIEDVILGASLMIMGTVFFARFRKREEKAKWKYYLSIVVIMAGAMTAVWDIFFHAQR